MLMMILNLGDFMAIHEKFGKGRHVLKPNDKIYTPEKIAKQMISFYSMQGKVLDPFKGGGVFYDNLPTTVEKYWCEIDEGVDFFEFDKQMDWIISNPPYSIYDEVLEHSFKLSKNVVYLVPFSKVVSSLGRIKKILNYGNIKSIKIIGASKCGFPFGFPACSIHIQRGYGGDTMIEMWE
jgi:hypothetical protein